MANDDQKALQLMRGGVDAELERQATVNVIEQGAGSHSIHKITLYGHRASRRSGQLVHSRFWPHAGIRAGPLCYSARGDSCSAGLSRPHVGSRRRPLDQPIPNLDRANGAGRDEPGTAHIAIRRPRAGYQWLDQRRGGGRPRSVCNRPKILRDLPEYCFREFRNPFNCFTERSISLTKAARISLELVVLRLTPR